MPLWKTAASLNIVPTSWDSTCPVNNYYRVITTCCLYSLRTTLRGHSVYLENKSWSTSSVQFYSFSPFLSFLLLPLVLILRELPNKSIAGNLCLKVYFSGMLTWKIVLKFCFGGIRPEPLTKRKWYIFVLFTRVQELMWSGISVIIEPEPICLLKFYLCVLLLFFKIKKEISVYCGKLENADKIVK